MIDPDSRHGRELKAAEEFFALARSTPSPFMRSYYQRGAERYLSSEGELRTGVSAPAAAEPVSQSATVTSSISHLRRTQSAVARLLELISIGTVRPRAAKVRLHSRNAASVDASTLADLPLR